jgi:guanylate kinase
MRSRSIATTQHTPILFLITAPSGAGKTTLCQNLMDADPQVRRVITCTTRAPRANETPDIDYHFLDKSTFQRGIHSGDFLEYAEVYGNHYGTRKKDVFDQLDAGHDMLLNIDVQGAESIRKHAIKDPQLLKSLVTVFLTPPSLDELETRLRNRNTDQQEVIQKRLTHAKREIEHWKLFDFLIISGSVSEDLQRLQSIVHAERLKADRQRLPEVVRDAVKN